MQRSFQGLCILITILFCCNNPVAAKQYSDTSDTVFVISESELMSGLQQIVRTYQKYHSEPVQSATQNTNNQDQLLRLLLLMNLSSQNPNPQQVYPYYMVPRQQSSQGYNRYNEFEQYPINVLPSSPQLIPIPGLSQNMTRPTTVLYPPTQNYVPQTGTALVNTETENKATAELDSQIESIKEELKKLEQIKLHMRDTVKTVIPQTTLVPVQPTVIRDTTVVYVKQAPVVAPQPQENRLASYFKRQVFFRQGSARLTATAIQTLNETIEVLKHNAHSTLYLTGYASPEGNKQFNEALTKERSETVYLYLIKHGVNAEKLKIVAGEIGNDTEIPSISRRVDLDLTPEMP